MTKININALRPKINLNALRPSGDVDWDGVVTGLRQNSFPGHHGRPGERGGSLPKSQGGEVRHKIKIGDMSNIFNDQIAGKIKSGKAEEVGFSYQPFTHNYPSSGFMSSEFQDRGGHIPVDKFNTGDLVNYTIENAKYFRDPDLYLGGWVSDGEVYLDISKRFESKNDALQSAIDHKQLAVFDLSKIESVYTSHLFDPSSPSYSKEAADAFKNGGKYPGAD